MIRWLCLCAATAILVGCTNSAPGTKRDASADDKSDVEAFVAQQLRDFQAHYKDAIKVSATDFLATYQNQFAGDKRFKGKFVALELVPWKIVENDDFDEQHGKRYYLGPPYALFTESGNEDALGVCCEFAEHERYDQRNLLCRSGVTWVGGDQPIDAPVTVVGECQGIGSAKGHFVSGMKTIRLVRCAVLTSRDELQKRQQAKAKAEKAARTKADAEIERQVREAKAIPLTSAELKNSPTFRLSEWRGKVLEVTGQVESVGEEQGDLFIDMKGSVRFFFKAKNQSDLAKLQPGQAVRIRGMLKNGLYEQNLEYCLLVK